MKRGKIGDSGYPGEIIIEEKPSIAGKALRILGFIVGFILIKFLIMAC